MVKFNPKKIFNWEVIVRTYICIIFEDFFYLEKEKMCFQMNKIKSTNFSHFEISKHSKWCNPVGFIDAWIHDGSSSLSLSFSLFCSPNQLTHLQSITIYLYPYHGNIIVHNFLLNYFAQFRKRTISSRERLHYIYLIQMIVLLCGHFECTRSEFTVFS